MRVLVLTNMYPSAHNAGDGIFVRRQIDALKRERESLELRVCFFDTIRGKWLYGLGWLRSIWLVWRWKPDLVHVHYGLTQLCWPPWLAWLRPTVVTFHGSDLTIGWQRLISMRMLGGGTRVVCVSSSLTPLVVPPPRNGLRVVPCGVASRRFAEADPTAARRRLGLRNEQRLLLFGANPERPVKNHRLFKQVLDLLAEDGWRGATLADVPVAEVPSLIAAADVMLLTSLREGSPVVTKEALCAGCRVVSVDVGDVHQQLEGFSGTEVVRSGNPQDIVHAVHQVLRVPSPDKTLAAERFDHRHEARALLALYDEISLAARRT